MILTFAGASLCLGLWFTASACHRGRLLLSPPVFFMGLLAGYVVIPAVAGHYMEFWPLSRTFWWFQNDRVLAGVLLGWWAFVFGTVCAVTATGASGVWGRRSDAFAGLELEPLQSRTAWIALSVVGGVALMGTFAFFYTRRDAYLAILVADQIGGQRQQLRAGAGLFTMNFTYAIPWIALLSFLQLRARPTRGIRALFVVSLFVSIVAQAALLFRGNLLFFLLLFVVAWGLVKMRLERRTVAWIGVAVAFIVLATATRVPREDWGTSRFPLAVAEALTRRLTTPIFQLGHVLDTFPRPEFSPGTTQVMDVVALRPGYDVNFNGLIYTETGTRGPGTATVTMVGDGYATAGFPGIALEAFLLGLVTALVHLWLVSGRKSVPRVFLGATATIYLGKAVLGGVTSYVTQPVVVMGLSLTILTVVAAVVTVVRLGSAGGMAPGLVMATQPGESRARG